MNDINAAEKYVMQDPNKVYETDPKKVSVADLVSTAMQEVCLGHPAVALLLLEKALEINPEDVIIYKWLGITQEHLGKNVFAVKAYQKAVQIAEKSDLYNNFI